MDLPSKETVFGIMLTETRYKNGEGLPSLIWEYEGISGISINSEPIENCDTACYYAIAVTAGGHHYISGFTIDISELNEFGFSNTIKRKVTTALNDIIQAKYDRVGVINER